MVRPIVDSVNNIMLSTPVAYFQTVMDPASTNLCVANIGIFGSGTISK